MCIRDRDVTTQIDVLKAFKRVVKERNITAVYVSHDLAVVAQMADKVVVLNKGKIKEQGTTEQVITNPQNDYTKSLMAAAQHSTLDQPNLLQIKHQSETVEDVTLLSVDGLIAGYGKINRDGLPKTTMLKNLNFRLARGKTLGIIGESGSGKSTLARVIAGLLPAARGNVNFLGRPLPKALSERSVEQLKDIQLVFQNADTALNPSHTIETILGRPLNFYHGLHSDKNRQRIMELLELVKLPKE